MSSTRRTASLPLYLEPPTTTCHAKSEPLDDYVRSERIEEYMYMILYSYIIKRTSAILIIEDGIHRINDRYGSKTDAAFVAFLNALIKNADMKRDHIHQVAGYGRTAMVDDQLTIRAFRIFTEEPMQFKVQRKTGDHFEKQKFALFWFTDVEPRGKFDTSWEYMSKELSECIHSDENYDMEAKTGRTDKGLLSPFN